MTAGADKIKEGVGAPVQGAGGTCCAAGVATCPAHPDRVALLARYFNEKISHAWAAGDMAKATELVEVLSEGIEQIEGVSVREVDFDAAFHAIAYTTTASEHWICIPDWSAGSVVRHRPTHILPASRLNVH